MKLLFTKSRLSFGDGLFTPRAFEPGLAAKFGADFIQEPSTQVFEISANSVRIPTTMDAAMLKVADEAWQGRGKEMLTALEPSKKSYRDGNARIKKSGEVYSGYAGNKYLTAKNAARPGLFDKDGKTPITEADGKLYSGCIVNASVDLFAMTDPKKKGVFCTLLGVQLVSDGEAFSGSRVSSGDEFVNLAEGANANDLC